jgi:hypothetical protein
MGIVALLGTDASVTTTLGGESTFGLSGPTWEIPDVLDRF